MNTACAPSARTIDPADLSDLIPSSAEAPVGTEFYPAPSGPQRIDTLTQNVPTANDEAGGLEFIGGFGSFFVTPGFDPFGGGGSHSPEATLIGTAAFAFADPEDASEALRIHRELVVRAVTSGAVETVVDDLGEEAHSFTFERGVTPLPGAIYAFRVANVVFVVAGSGENLDPTTLLDIARATADRARFQLVAGRGHA